MRSGVTLEELADMLEEVLPWLDRVSTSLSLREVPRRQAWGIVLCMTLISDFLRWLAGKVPQDRLVKYKGFLYFPCANCPLTLSVSAYIRIRDSVESRRLYALRLNYDKGEGILSLDGVGTYLSGRDLETIREKLESVFGECRHVQRIGDHFVFRLPVTGEGLVPRLVLRGSRVGVVV